MNDKGVTLRAATQADTSSLAGVQLRSALAGFSHIFPSSIPKPTLHDLEAEWAAILADEAITVFVADQGATPVGVAVYGPDPEPGFATDGYFRKLYVLPEESGRGIGSTLHDHAIADLAGDGFTRIRLWVLERNLVARRMYERRGWKLQPWCRSDWPGSGILELGYALEIDYSSAM